MNLIDLIVLDYEFSKKIDAVISEGIMNLKDKDTKKRLDLINFDQEPYIRIGQF